jgi:hypothetical protein
MDGKSHQMGSLLDLVPVLRHLPAALLPVKKEGLEIHQRELKLFRRLYTDAKKGLKDGTAKVREKEQMKDYMKF